MTPRRTAPSRRYPNRAPAPTPTPYPFYPLPLPPSLPLTPTPTPTPTPYTLTLTPTPAQVLAEMLVMQRGSKIMLNLDNKNLG